MKLTASNSAAQGLNRFKEKTTTFILTISRHIRVNQVLTRPMTYRLKTNIKLLLTSAMRHPLLFFYLRFLNIGCNVVTSPMYKGRATYF